MSITEKFLSQTEKQIMFVLCFRSRENNEVYSSIKKLALNCSCSIKTVERTLKQLRDKGYLVYTGKLAPKSRSIPIYSINLTDGQSVRGPTLTTDNLSLTDGQFGNPRTDNLGIGIDHKNIDNKKDNGFSLEPTQQEKNDVKYYLNSSYKMPDELQPTYLWLSENGKI